MTYEESLLIIANNILQIESNTEKIQYLTKELDNAIVS